MLLLLNNANGFHKQSGKADVAFFLRTRGETHCQGQLGDSERNAWPIVEALLPPPK